MLKLATIFPLKLGASQTNLCYGQFSTRIRNKVKGESKTKPTAVWDLAMTSDHI